MKKCIILANGQPPGKVVFNFLKRQGYDTLLCADGGANSAFKYKLIPDFIIGDFDSIDEKILDYYKHKSKIIQIKRQNDTDLGKCLKYSSSKKYKEAVILGATGDRLDHSFCNLGIVLKFYDKIRIKIIHQKSLLCAYSKNIELTTVKGEIISLYGFDERTKIISEGLKYPLNNIALPFGQKESTSNVALGDKIKLQIQNGKIFVIRDFEVLVKHGLFQLT
jgi:thiamine pyrophosphokinase